jgi:hypothetical protein
VWIVAAKYGDLVPEHQDLDVFRCVDRASSASQLSTRASVK